MMVNRKELKSKSKEQLRGQWKIPVLITLIISIIQVISNYTVKIFVDNLPIHILLLILNLLITLSIGIMVNSFYLKVSRDKKVGFSDIFIPWKTFGKGIGIELLLGLIIIPIITIIAIINSLSPSSGIMIGITVLLTLILCIALIILGLYFFPAVILVCEDNNRGIIQCIKESFKLMKGNLWNLFVLQLSFIGWVILCITPTIFIAILIVFPLNVLSFVTIVVAFSLHPVALVILFNIASIGFLWLVPYMNTTLLNFFNEISGATNNPMYNEITSLN